VRVKILNVLVVALIAAGIALAVTGKNTLKWAPPPLPQKWEAPAAQLARHQPPAARARGRFADSDQDGNGQSGAASKPGRSRPAAGADQGRVAAAPASAPSQPRQSPHEPGRTTTAAIPAHAATPMARSVPVSVEIPAIGVRASIIRLGLQAGGAMEVPPLTHPFLAGWFDQGPTPGQRGTAVIVGHVDAAGVGPAVFYELGELRPGDRINVTLADGRTAVFAVWAAALYPKADFPSTTVYAYTSQPSLRLITCGGIFDPQTGHYLSNIVVFASYLGPA
jgi:sortase family protein